MATTQRIKDIAIDSANFVKDQSLETGKSILEECIPKSPINKIYDTIYYIASTYIHVPYFPAFHRPGWLLRYLFGPFDLDWIDGLVADFAAGITVALTLIPQVSICLTSIMFSLGNNLFSLIQGTILRPTGKSASTEWFIQCNSALGSLYVFRLFIATGCWTCSSCVIDDRRNCRSLRSGLCYKSTASLGLRCTSCSLRRDYLDRNVRFEPWPLHQFFGASGYVWIYKWGCLYYRT